MPHVSTGITMMEMGTVDTVMQIVRFVRGVVMIIARGVIERQSHSSCITRELVMVQDVRPLTCVINVRASATATINVTAT